MKNWTVREAVQVIREGKDQEAIKEIAKHFPLFAMIVAAEDFEGLANAMPDKITVRKIENELNSGGAVEDDAEDQDDSADDASDDKDGAQDLDSMSKNELIALCEKKGIKVQKYQKPKQYYIDALSKASDAKSDGDVDDEVDEGDDPVELYKQCKKAGLKVAPKKSAKYYKDALKKAEQAAEDADDDAEDWDDDDAEDQEEEKPAKGSKSSKSGSSAKGAKSSSKAKAKAEPEDEDDDDEDDDEDWDI